MPSQPKSLRLNLKPQGPPYTRYHGGWWPRSRNLAAELPVVLHVLAARLGIIRRVGYNPGTWGPMSKLVTVDGYVVRLEGFPSLDTYSLRITSRSPGVFCLLVVPPDADEPAGGAALTAATVQNGLSRDVLAACGALPGTASFLDR